MTEDERWAYLVALDEELLRGGVIMSEWTAEIVRQADSAFAGGAFLASLLTVVAAIESHLRAEIGADAPTRLTDLIDASDLEDRLRSELHHLRQYRNRWVHVNDPWFDEALLTNHQSIEDELEKNATAAEFTLRRVLYTDPWI